MDGIGKRIQALREARGWTMTDLGRQAGVSKATVSRIEGDKGEISVPALARIADALEVSMDVLIGRGGFDVPESPTAAKLHCPDCGKAWRIEVAS